MGLDYRNLSRDEMIRLLESRERALRESSEIFIKAFRASPDSITVTDAETGCILDVNDGFEKLFGYRREEAIGKNTLDFNFWAVPEDRLRMVEQLRRQGSMRDFQTTGRQRDGKLITCLLSAESIEIAGRLSIVLVVRDITKRQQAEEALRESQRVMSTLLSNLPGMVYRCKNNLDWTMEFVSEGCRELTGYVSEDLLQDRKTSYGKITHNDDQLLVWDAIQAAIKEQRPFELTYRIFTANGTMKWVWERGQGIFSTQGELLALEGFITDITARRKAEIDRAKALIREQQAREEYTRQLINAQETERTRIARELHDSLGQNLLLIKNRVQLAFLNEASPGNIREQLENISQLASQTIAEVRAISRDLHPYQIDHLGLTKSIEVMADAAAEGSHIQFQRKLQMIDDAFSADAALNLYRVAQESLNNIIKHSRAKNASIELERDLHEVELRIQDDGVGFTNEIIGASSAGLGLKNIAERVRILGGNLKIAAAPGKGTALTIILPIQGKSQFNVASSPVL